MQFSVFLHTLRKVPQWIALVSSRLRSLAPSADDITLATSMDLADSPAVRCALGYAPAMHSLFLPSGAATFLGWGRKGSGRRAVALAAKEHSDFLLLEDGFLRSVGRSDDTLSLVLDNAGIYYDASRPSQIESHIAAELSPAEAARTAETIAKWRQNRVSKYNSAPEYSDPLPARYVLVLDQVAGDMSIGYGAANAASFQRMLQAALVENPEATVIVKMHPDVFTRAKRGHFDVAALKSTDRVLIVAENCHPVRLIEQAEAVYTVTSQVGFEALIWGKSVRCFGMPFYAGWGLTQDELPAPARRGSATLEQLVHGALVKYPRYIDPERQTCCEIEPILAHIGLQRRMLFRFPKPLYALAFSRWKRPYLRRFLAKADIKFVRDLSSVSPNATVAIWGNAIPPGAPDTMKFLRIEDGFLRSAGLGADLIQPLSWVIDDIGLYYDASRPSRLEAILQLAGFDSTLLRRAEDLRADLIDKGVTKYNLGGTPWMRPDTDAPVILVPGQVENDASIRFGAPQINTNIGLLGAVRAANPDAYIVYKPHPDVVAGLRRSGQGEQDAVDLCDAVVVDANAVQMLTQFDEVHTMTSLLGFEALIRGVAVTCYGQPFYAGWGLTRDFCRQERRTRRLSIDELVAGALIQYPAYVSRVTKRYTTPERAAEELMLWQRSGPSRMPVHRRFLRAILRLWVASGLRRNA